jgi:hypothetical protein
MSPHPKSPVPSPGDGGGQTPGRRRRRAEILDAAGSSAAISRRRRIRAELLDGNWRLRRELLHGKAASGVSAASCWTERRRRGLCWTAGSVARFLGPHAAASVSSWSMASPGTTWFQFHHQHGKRGAEALHYSCCISCAYMCIMSSRAW